MGVLERGGFEGPVGFKQLRLDKAADGLLWRQRQRTSHLTIGILHLDTLAPQKCVDEKVHVPVVSSLRYRAKQCLASEKKNV